MLNRSILLIVTLLCISKTTLYSFSIINDLPNKKPYKIYADEKDRFFIELNDSIIVYSDKIDYIIKPEDPGYTTDKIKNIVLADGTVYSIIHSHSSGGKLFSDIVYHHISIVTCSGPSDYRQRILCSWIYDPNSNNNQSYELTSFLISEDNSIFYTIHKSGYKSEKKVDETFYYFNNQETDRESFKKYLISAKVIWDIKDKEASSFQNRSVVVRDTNNRSHEFFSKGNSLYHRFYSEQKKRIIDIKVDGPECKYKNLAFLSGDNIWTIHYFFRDSFNKGLLVSVSNINSGNVEKQFVIDASKKKNIGWDLVGEKSSTGRILFTYKSDELKNKRIFILLNSVEELQLLGQNLKKYGNPQGIGDSNRELGEELSNSYLKKERNFNLKAGAGLKFLMWNTVLSTPSDVTNPYDIEYDFSDSLMNVFSIEGVFNSISIGADFITKYVDREIEQDNSEANSLNSWRGWFGWYNLRLELEYSKTSVLLQDRSNQVNDKKFYIDFYQSKLSLLGKRGYFNFLYQNYNFYQPVYIYKCSAGSTSYQLYSRPIGEIETFNYALQIGTSIEDYLAKYETEYNDWFSIWDFNMDIPLTTIMVKFLAMNLIVLYRNFTDQK